jgi:(5-formylfuran-3-yl)methyl phosphate synthase
MRLLVSVINEKEAKNVIRTSRDIIIDVKNPMEGSLGASFPYIIKKIRKIIPSNVEISAAIGDIPNLPGTASLAALGVATFHVNYIKIGLMGPKTEKEAIYLMKNVIKTVKGFDKSIKIVAAGYGDYKRVNTLDPLSVLKIAYYSKADVVMLDTAIKDGKKLTDFLENSFLKNFVREAHEKGLMTAFAGSLGIEDIKTIYETGVDIFGVRGAVCEKRDRKAKLKAELVRKLFEEIKRLW